jgi:hypothetical protein
MKTIYLHVGNFKTGTSAIQKYCSHNRRQLLGMGYDYIKSARPRSNNTNHGKLPISLIMQYEQNIPTWYDDKESFGQVSKAVIEEIEKSSEDNIIISSEEFYRIPGCKAPTVENAKVELRALFSKYNVKVIMYVRKPLDMTKSWYNQVNKSNKPTRRFTDFFYYMNNSLLLPQQNADFWRSCFGENCLTLEPYHLNSTEHIHRFIELIGISNPLDFRTSVSKINPRRNEDTLESDRISRIMLLESESERNVYLNSFVFLNTANEKKLMEKIKFINQKFANFCESENLPMPKANFDITDLLAHEKKVNRNDTLTPSPFRKMLAGFRNSELVRIAKTIRRTFQR